MSLTTHAQEYFTAEPPKGAEERELLSETLFYAVVRVYLQLFITGCGLVGNTLAVLVLRGSKFKHSSTSPYLFCLAISDNIYLILAASMVPLMTYLGYKDVYITKINTGHCLSYYFIAYGSAQVSSWLITAVTVERVGVVAWPHKSKSLFTVRRSYIIIATIILVLAIENSHILFTFKVEPIGNNDTGCVAREQLAQFSAAVWPWLDSMMYTFVPFAIIIISNIIIISIVIKSSRRRQEMTTGQESKDDTETNRMTKMLISISIFFIITTTPISIYLFYADANDPDRLSENAMGYVVTSIVASLNHSCNFIMYSLSGPTFRMELKRIFTCDRDGSDRLGSSSWSSRSTIVSST